MMYGRSVGPAVKYEVFGHTADAGVKAYGDTMAEMFENAALGMFSLICEPEKVEPRGEYQIELEADNPETLLVDWLTELIFLHETQFLLLSQFQVQLDDERLTAVVRGEAIDKERHELKMSVKAVTYHQLEINEDEGYLRVLFDV